MIQLPENIRPYATGLAKHHFWILAAVVPLIMLPSLFVANRQLDEDMDAARGQIEARIASLRKVEAISPHPNEKWATDIDARTLRIKRETLAEWTKFWESQSDLRQWPAALGDDFVQRALALRPDGRLPRKLLERYQNGVRAIVRGLPARVGADERMLSANPAEQAGPEGSPAARSTKALVRWNEQDQRRIFASFNWDKPPSTAQAVLAQEEIWVYGLLCDSIARMNETAAGAYNAAITDVEQLSVGYPAAEEIPGNSTPARLVTPPAAAPQAADPYGMPPPSAADPSAAMPAPRPPHPRFSGQGVVVATTPTPDFPGMPADPAASLSPDDALRNWIYVSFDGRPFSAAELAASPEAQMVHLMPFVMRVVIDQRKLDAWLVDLATVPVPIDVRQVRINTSPVPAAAAGTGPPVVRRPHDIQVELRGTVGLATPPREAVVGLDAATAADPPVADQEQPPSPADPPPEGGAPDNDPAGGAPAVDEPVVAPAAEAGAVGPTAENEARP